jgi:hypothetical protein
MPLILPSNSISAVGYEVDNSLRFDDGSSDYLNRTPASAGNRRTWTFSTWFKRGNIGSSQWILDAYGGSSDEFHIYISSGNAIGIYTIGGGFGSNLSISTNNLVRDVSAWYHLVVRCDTTQATASDRLRIYLNGVEASYGTYNNFTLNGEGQVNEASTIHYLGRRNAGDYFDGYFAETVLVDGSSLDPTSFGEFDADTGIWKPIDVSGLTFGTNGFYLDFENSGSLGADVSGNGNNFTVNNLTSIDQTTDTPTNNFAVGNNLIPSLTTYSNGNLTVSNGASWKASGSTLAVTQGKWYAEMKVDSFGGVGMFFGVEDMDLVNIWSAVLVGTSVNGRGYYYYGTVYNNTAPSAFGASYTTGDIIGCALDMDNKFVYFSKNGVFQNSGDPTSGASGTGGLTLAGTTYCFAYAVYSSTVSLNFGSPPYTISSGNSDGNGYGNFEYSVPSGYYALNTKNLAEFG